MNKKKPIYLAVMAMLILPFNAFALSENTNAVVVKYQTTPSFSIESCVSASDCFFISKNSQQLLKNNGTQFFTNNSTSFVHIVGVLDSFNLPPGFGRGYQGTDTSTRSILISTDTISGISLVKGKIKYNNTYFCLYDGEIERANQTYSWLQNPRILAGDYSSSDSYVCPGTYNGFNLIDFYGLNPYVAPNPNPCGITQAEIDAGVTCGGNDSGSGSTDSNTELPMTEDEYREFQSVKIGVSLLILGVICVLSGIKYATND